MSIDENRELMARWTRVWNEGRLDLLPSCVSPEYIRHESSGQHVTVSPAKYAETIKATRTRIADLRFEIHDEVFLDNAYWTRWTLTGTDVETGKPFLRAGLQTYRIEGGRLAETWAATQPDGISWTG